MYGDKGHSDAIPLGVPGGEYFQSGSVDNFEASIYPFQSFAYMATTSLFCNEKIFYEPYVPKQPL